MTHSTTTAGPRRPMWVWALIGLWFVACLNPMPDDFPSERDRGESTGLAGDNQHPTDETPHDSASGGSSAGGQSTGGGAGAGSPPAAAPGGAGAGGTGGHLDADAGVTEADAGP